MNIDKLYNVEDAAERMGGLSPWTVRAWLSAGKLRRTKVGRRVMVAESEIMRFLAEQNPDPKTA